MTKQQIENQIINIFGNNLIENIHYEKLNSNMIEFLGYGENISHLNSKFFYQAVNGGYEQEFNGDLGYLLNENLSTETYIVLRERTYNIPKDANNHLVKSGGKISYSNKIDIVSGNIINNSLPKDSGIMLGHNYLCQSAANPIDNINFPNFMQKIVSELFNLDLLGFQQKFFVALLSDIDLLTFETNTIKYKYSNTVQIRNNNNYYLSQINNYRNNLRLIDNDFIHLVFKSNLIAQINAVIYINVFVVSPTCTLRKLKLNNKFYIDVQ